VLGTFAKRIASQRVQQIVPELLLIAILLTVVLGASVLIGAHINRLNDSLPSDLDDRLADVESSLGRVESVVFRSETAIRQQAGRERDTENALRGNEHSAQDPDEVTVAR
jgi:hypothetical protein